MAVQPSTRRDMVVEDLHGRPVEDPYRWLEGDEDPACEEWLAGQEQWLAQQAGDWGARGLFQSLLREFMEAGSRVSPPVWRNGCRFFLRHDAGREHPVLVAAMAGQGERVVVDPVTLDPSAQVTLDGWRPSWSGKLLAYQVSSGGAEKPVLTVVDVADGRRVGPEVRPGRYTPVAWLPDDAGFYYVTCAADGERQVRLRLLDTPGDPGEDAVVFATAFLQLSVFTSPNGRWLMVSCAPGSQCGNQMYLADLTAVPAHAPDLQLVYDGTTTGAEALIKFGPRDLLYAITTDEAPGGKVCRIDPAHPHSTDWTPLLRARPDAVLSACAALVEPGTGSVHFLVSSARRGVAGLSLHDSTGRLLADISTPGTGCGTITKLSVPPGESDRAWFIYTDFITAPAVYCFSLEDQRCHLDAPPKTAPGALSAQSAPVALPAPDTASAPPVGLPPSSSPQPEQPQVVAQQLTYTSEDGTEVPIFLIAPATRYPGPRPALLTAYGGFGVSAAPVYSPSILAWVAAGGIYAIAAVRGGGDLGTAWHQAGSGMNKPTAFADYAAAARWLITEGHTTPAQLAIKGASHSGLMVAAALTRDPDLYAAAVCSGALTDMLRYPRLGMGAWWISEFGDPSHPDHFNVLLGYSPYHRVRPGTRYPAVLTVTARTDPRVGAAHTRKFTAALQHATTSGKPVVLRCEDGVGHGPRAATRWIDMEADSLAFCATHTGLQPESVNQPLPCASRPPPAT